MIKKLPERKFNLYQSISIIDQYFQKLTPAYSCTVESVGMGHKNKSQFLEIITQSCIKKSVGMIYKYRYQFLDIVPQLVMMCFSKLYCSIEGVIFNFPPQKKCYTSSLYQFTQKLEHFTLLYVPHQNNNRPLPLYCIS